jgi:hypothetical protein
MLLGSSFLQPTTDITNANALKQSLERSFICAPKAQVMAQVTTNDLHPRILRCDRPGDNEFVPGAFREFKTKTPRASAAVWGCL